MAKFFFILLNLLISEIYIRYIRSSVFSMFSICSITSFQSSPKDGSNVDHPHFVYEDRPEALSSSSGPVDGPLNCKNTMMDGKVVDPQLVTWSAQSQDQRFILLTYLCDTEHVLRKSYRCAFQARNLEYIVDLKKTIYQFPNDLFSVISVA